MKSVMLSIQPQWCKKIISGEKTVEVRKTRPKLETPFKCYIYCTLSGSNEFFKDDLKGDVASWNRGMWGVRKGHVIGEFVCDDCSRLTKDHYSYIEQYGQICRKDLDAYMGIQDGESLSYSDGCYGWHISDLKIYEEPKPLGSFRKPCGNDLTCKSCGMYSANSSNCRNAALRLTRPPQSWCYVEELE